MKIPLYKIRSLLLATVLTAGITGCSKMDDSGGDGTPLPEGQYPLELTSKMDEIISRATTDNTWTGTEEIAMMVTGTPSSTIKNYTAAATGKLSAKSGTEPFYWTLSSESKTVSAWYPYSASAPANFTVLDNQSSTGYAGSDFLYAAPKTIAFTDATKSLTFKHLPARVVFNIKKGDGVTDAEVQGATVTIANQSLTSGTITLSTGAVAQATSGSATVTPAALTAASGFQKSIQALLTPRQMKNLVFIKIGIGNDTFGYKPTNETDGNLESGKCYTYEITVKRNGLEVKLTESDTWTNGGSSDVESEKVKPKVGDYYYTDKTFSTALDNSKTVRGVLCQLKSDGSPSMVVSIAYSNPTGLSMAQEWCGMVLQGGGRLPSIDELQTVYSWLASNQAANNKIITDAGGATFAGDYLSSSGGIYPDYNKIFNFDTGTIREDYNGYSYNVRAVLTF